MAQSLEPASDSVSLSLSLHPIHTLSLSLSPSKINKHLKKIKNKRHCCQGGVPLATVIIIKTQLCFMSVCGGISGVVGS